MTPGLVCPHCGTPDDTRTLNSRQHASGRNRRHLCGCGGRFTTIEVVVTEKPRHLVGLKLTDAGLTKRKIIARITAELEAAL